MKSLLFIIGGLLITWYFTDLQSENIFCSVLSPIGICLFLISLSIWLVAKAGFGGKADGSGGIASSDFFDGGGDGEC